MAKVKSTIATSLQGRIGNVSFRRASGQRIIAAELPSLVTNPRTEAQMSQRVKLAALVAFYRASRAWQPKAWQRKEAKQSNYNAFVKANLANTRVAFTKQEAAAGAAVVYPWQVSAGSLPPVSFTTAGSDLVSDIYLGASPAPIAGDATVADLTSALIANNLSLRIGDQISVVVYQQGVNPVSGTPYITCRPYEVTLDAAGSALVSEVFPGNILKAVQVQGIYNLALDTTKFAAAALVVSRRSDVGLEVSPAALQVSNSSSYNYYITDAHAAEAARSYGEVAEVFLDPSTDVQGYDNAAVARQVLGVYVGASANNLQYFPAGEAAPSITTGNLVRVRLSDTVGIDSLAILSAGNVTSTVSGASLTVTESYAEFTAASTIVLKKVTATYEDSGQASASWNVGDQNDSGGIE